MAKKAKSAVAVAEAAEVELMISIPMGAAPEGGYELKQALGGKVSMSKTLHINLQVGDEAALALLRLRSGLRERNEKLRGGRPVYTNIDTVRWLLERVAEASEEIH